MRRLLPTLRLLLALALLGQCLVPAFASRRAGGRAAGQHACACNLAPHAAAECCCAGGEAGCTLGPGSCAPGKEAAPVFVRAVGLPPAQTGPRVLSRALAGRRRAAAVRRPYAPFPVPKPPPRFDLLAA